MELTVAEGDSVNGIKRLKNGCASYLSVFIMYKYPSQSYTFLMHNYEDAPQDRLINKMWAVKKLSLSLSLTLSLSLLSLSVCVCVLKDNEATCVQHCTYCFHFLFLFFLTRFYWKHILISTNSVHANVACLTWGFFFGSILSFLELNAGNLTKHGYFLIRVS